MYNVILKQLLVLPRFQNLLLIIYDHINTICAIIQRFGKNGSMGVGVGMYAVVVKSSRLLSHLLVSSCYTFSEFITTKILAIWQHLGRFLAIFSPRMRKNSYFS